MDDNDKNQETEPTSRKGWWQRCRESIKETWSFTKKHAPKSAGVVGKLYYLSLISGWASLGAGMYGVPGATQVSIASFGMAKAFKLLWDQLRDIQDATEDLVNKVSGPEIRLDETDQKIQQLELIIAEQQEIISAQQRASSDLLSTHEIMQEALTNSTHKIQQLEGSHAEVTAALEQLLREKKNERRLSRNDMRAKYQSELDTALQEGKLTQTNFEPDRDSVVRFEEEIEEQAKPENLQ
tara:strand:+ start:376 stop:1092 length:717 start_codon:yes stop_codon:yes gene_type:complete